MNSRSFQVTSCDDDGLMAAVAGAYPMQNAKRRLRTETLAAFGNANQSGGDRACSKQASGSKPDVGDFRAVE